MNDAAVIPIVEADGALRLQPFLTQPAQENHIVQFYDDEHFLCDNVTQFLAAGLTAGEPVVVIATLAHRESFTVRLKLHGCNVESALASGQLTLLDARRTLDTFMSGDEPDWERFKTVIGGLLEQSRQGRGDKRIRAYGEMVDLLWKDGNKRGAIGLERLWNDLGQVHSFSLLCAYVMGNFYQAADGERFREVCAAHTHVIPTEKLSQLENAESWLRAISELEQRARSLESEIAHRKELESALREALASETAARREAEHNARWNELFAGMLGHDLRNPLAAILLGANYIGRLDAGEKTTKAAARILASSERMSLMIDQLLDFTRIRAGKGLELNRERVEIDALCRRVAAEMETAHRGCSIRVESDDSAVGDWDGERLAQVLSTLMGNAVVHGACVVSIRASGDEVVVLVSNPGQVAAEMLPVLFEPFRAGGKQVKTRGLGLGLYIARQIVLAHDGSMEVCCHETTGTTLRVALPKPPLGK